MWVLARRFTSWTPAVAAPWGRDYVGGRSGAERMRIAEIAPLHESVPPKLYGGTERVVHFLTEALIDLGHDVTLFASGDSQTRAELVACAPSALRLDESCKDPLAPHLNMFEQVFARAGDFDVLHFHTD